MKVVGAKIKVYKYIDELSDDVELANFGVYKKEFLFNAILATISPYDGRAIIRKDDGFLYCVDIELVQLVDEDEEDKPAINSMYK